MRTEASLGPARILLTREVDEIEQVEGMHPDRLYDAHPWAQLRVRNAANRIEYQIDKGKEQQGEHTQRSSRPAQIHSRLHQHYNTVFTCK